ncbi:jg5045 [Pararge aegeria aegeria]|uniref:Jg5045 protein n=1 Tax=Pararge aegeria aegeria TaxID=348720 RepID=A0A8S4SDP0_9NEOP|nr:jg5045 [Pararge aegeria aegeria]
MSHDQSAECKYNKYLYIQPTKEHTGYGPRAAGIFREGFLLSCSVVEAPLVVIQRRNDALFRLSTACKDKDDVRRSLVGYKS